jgi:hypothetical protein
MNQFHHPFYVKLKETLKNAAHTIKDALAELMEQEHVTVEDIAEIIKQHPDTSIIEQTLLGITYRFYHLTVENTAFYMETRVINSELNTERILFINLSTTEKPLFTYRSFEGKPESHKQVKVNGTIKNLVQSSNEESFV